MAAKNKKQLGLLDEAKDILEYNKDIELNIINIVRRRIDCEGLTEINIVFHVTLEIFEKEKSHLLSSFYKARFLTDLTVKLIMPNKDKATKVYAGEKDKKSNGPLLIQLTFDVRTLPIIGKVPELPPVKIS